MAHQLPVVIDRSSPVPLYHQLEQQLTAAIETGLLRPGDTFENEVSLAERLRLSRPTVRRAIAEMVTRGLLVRRRGVGTTVADEVIHRRSELTSLHEDLQRAGRTPSTVVLSFEFDSYNDRAAQALRVPVDTPLLAIEQLRSADGVALAVLRNWIPPEYATITAAELEETGLYGLLRERGARLTVAHQTIGARVALGRERKLLGLAKSDPVLTMSRRAFAADGMPVEFGDHIYRADQYAFDLTVHQG